MKLQINNEEVYVASGNREPDPECDSVIFIHGTGQDHTIWVLPTRYFARHGKNVLAIDLPGHGRSGGAPLESIEDMADWVIIAVLDAAGLDARGPGWPQPGFAGCDRRRGPASGAGTGRLRWSERPCPCQFLNFCWTRRMTTAIWPSTC